MTLDKQASVTRRRGMLLGLGGTALAALAALRSSKVAEAANGQQVTQGQDNQFTTTTTLTKLAANPGASLTVVSFQGEGLIVGSTTNVGTESRGTIGVVGYFYAPVAARWRVLFIVAGVLTLIPADMFPGAIITDIAGLALGTFLIGRELRRRRAPA